MAPSCARTQVARAGLVLATSACFVVACGESRRPIGEECLRDSDCLSDVCAARTCVSAPSLVRGTTTPPDDEEPRIPDDAGVTTAPDRDGSDNG